MFPVSTAAATLKNNFYTAVQTLFASTQPDVLVCFGNPGPNYPNDFVSLGRVTSGQQPANLGTNRSRDELLTLDIVVSSYRGGGPEAEQTASNRVYELLGAIENQVRTTDTTVAGAALWCFLTAHQSDGYTSDDDTAPGRLIECTATFTARVRISN